uniref:Transposable element protein, putative n=2 Tax=Oryza sativa subsp. japonica TaxID=39947 RepID=Q2R6M7_ORYSJ|nr:Transposable element protein, putative [Oryza sativa Japonica Group]ABA92926.1 Transposable element protein, putative, Transposase_28 [Oryza sativa Japonica Group]
MAPRKPNPASAKGPDPGRVDDDSTAFLGVSLMDDVELVKLVSSGALVEGQAFAPGKAVVPKPIDNRTVVFTVFFKAGLRFPCNVLLPEILRLFQVELTQLSLSALVRIAIFDWACRTSGFEPNAEFFGAIFFATVNSKTVITPAGTKKTVFGSVNFNVRPERSDLWPVNAAMSKWDRHWMARWFYHSIPFEAGSDSTKALRCRRRAIAPNRKPKIAVDGALEARFVLLRKVCSRLSCHDLVEEFCMLRIFPLSQAWQVTVDQGEEVDGLPNLILPERTNTRRMIGDVSVVEYSQLLTRQASGQANRVCNGELPPRANPHKADDDAGPSQKRMRRQVKLAPRKRRVLASSDSDADDEDDAEERDGENEGEEEEEEAVADKAAKEAIEDRVDTPGYTPTPSPGHNETGVESNSSPLRRKDLEGAKALVAFSLGTVAKGGPVKKVSKKKGLVDIARVFSDDESSDETPTSPAGRSLDLSTAPLASLSVAGAGGSPAAGASASAEQIVSAAARVFGSPILAAHCSTERTVRARFDGFKSRLRAKDDEISRKNLEVEALAHTLKEAKAEVKRLQSELDKGKEARGEVDRLKAELEKEKAHSAVLIDYYNLIEPKMEALRQKASRAEASAAEESQRFSREMAKTT